MARNFADLDVLESLRESGDYDKLGALLTDGWQTMPEFDNDVIRLRLIAAELAGRAGRLDEMEAAISPYIDECDRVPLDWPPASCWGQPFTIIAATSLAALCS